MGNIVGLWFNYSGFDLRKMKQTKSRFLVWPLVYLCFTGFTDFLAWCIIPQDHYHEWFNMSFLIFMMVGFLAVILPAHAFRWSQGRL